ncbi:MAG: Methyltransferase type 12 [Candidatus Moranbacteria bacterium GW2011_GWF2_36_839]|nr:MAG: Methyltransferase type 12 [Candidatus Moranbacteria bacterium GW2011_GWF1_36_78]KKQ17679.1 MAG: Methyltransferase type 12 [Candidatus Moranbacteria bacterium GW2011_GWF2_36_839]HAT73382.1 hypothetical protein [Candidatus Moranbacteria bacterium]HBY10745.1 hypothetical protein [Candidatus Moranbacteria bacterium]
MEDAKKENIFSSINCPVCKNNKFKIVIELTPDQFLNKERKEYYNLKVLGVDDNTKFFIKKCKKCGFVFVNPRLRSDLYSVVYNEAKVSQNEVKNWEFKEDDLGNLYNLYSKYREIFPFLSALQFFREYFKKAKNDGYKQLRLLDYGCGQGHILDLCKVFGIDGIGVDIDSFRLNYCKQKDLNVMLPSELPSSEKFHIIISDAVIEHIDDLDAYFKYASERLSKNGIFYLTGLTPSIIRIEKRDGCYKRVMPLEHINYFTRKNLLRLAGRYEFKEAKRSIGVFATKNIMQYSYPILKKFIFRGFYPTGYFEITLIKK